MSSPHLFEGSPSGSQGKRRSIVGFGDFGKQLINKARHSIGDPVLHGIKKGATATAVAVSDVMHLPGRNVRHPTLDQSVAAEGLIIDDSVEEPSGWSSLQHPTPLPFIKASGHAWSCNGSEYIVVAGRSQLDASRLGVYIMDCATSVWKALNPKGAPPVRFGHTAVVAANALIVYGGWSREEVYQDVFFLDLIQVCSGKKGRWTEPSFSTKHAPPPRAFHSAVLLGDEQMLIFGGSVFNTWKAYTYYDDLWVLNLIHFRWEKHVCKGKPPAPRAQHTAVTLPRHDGGVDMVVFGGVTDNWLLNDFYYLDTATFTWTPINATADCPFSRVVSSSKEYRPPTGAHRPAVVYDGCIYIYGGGPAQGDPIQPVYSVEILSTGEREGLVLRWSHLLLRYHPQRWNHLLLVLEDGSLFLIGGSDHSNEGHTDKAKRQYQGVFGLSLSSFAPAVDQEVVEEVQEEDYAHLNSYRLGEEMTVENEEPVYQQQQQPQLRATSSGGGVGGGGWKGQEPGWSSPERSQSPGVERQVERQASARSKAQSQYEETTADGESDDSFVTDVAFTMSNPFAGEKKEKNTARSTQHSTQSRTGSSFYNSQKSQRAQDTSASHSSRHKHRKARDRAATGASVLDTVGLTLDTFGSPRSYDHVHVHQSRMIGKGTFGKVFQGLHPITGEFVAVKQLKTSGVPPKDREKIKAEINLLRGLEHENIVRYLGSYVHDGRVNIVMEYVSGGSLLDLIGQHRTGLPEIVVQRYVRQVVNGVAYLHGRNLMHRDIKPANILVDATGVCKVADFGASKHLRTNTTVFGQTRGPGTEIQGTPLYMAPEMISGAATNDLKSDVWSIGMSGRGGEGNKVTPHHAGCTVVEMLDGQRPWHHIADVYSEAIPLCMYVVSRTDEHPLCPEKSSDNAKNFLCQCFERKLEERPTCATLTGHPWVCVDHPHARKPQQQQQQQQQQQNIQQQQQQPPQQQQQQQQHQQQQNNQQQQQQQQQQPQQQHQQQQQNSQQQQQQQNSQQQQQQQQQPPQQQHQQQQQQQNNQHQQPPQHQPSPPSTATYEASSTTPNTDSPKPPAHTPTTSPPQDQGNRELFLEMAMMREQLSLLQSRLGLTALSEKGSAHGGSPYNACATPSVFASPHPGDSIFSAYEDPEAMLSDTDEDEDGGVIIAARESPQKGRSSPATPQRPGLTLTEALAQRKGAEDKSLIKMRNNSDPFLNAPGSPRTPEKREHRGADVRKEGAALVAATSPKTPDRSVGGERRFTRNDSTPPVPQKSPRTPIDRKVRETGHLQTVDGK